VRTAIEAEEGDRRLLVVKENAGDHIGSGRADGQRLGDRVFELGHGGSLEQSQDLYELAGAYMSEVGFE
jgi:hypothetical protein